MKSIKRIKLTGSARKVQAHLGPSTRALSPRGIRVALLAALVLAMALSGLAFRPATADGQEAAGPVWSADMTVVEYTSVSIGATSADLFSNVGGSGNLQIKSLWSYLPDRDLRLAFDEDVANAADYTVQAGGLSLEFPPDSSGASSFKWNDVDVHWEDGQIIHVRILPTAEIDAPQANTPATGVPTVSGTARVGGTLAADTSSVADVDGLANVSYAYQWIRTDGGADADIAGATDSTYTLTDDDQGKTIKLKVTFNDDKGNSETLAIVAAANVAESEQKPQFLVSNLGAGVGGAGGIQRTLGAARSGFAQAFTTGAKTGGYAPGSVGVQVSHFFDGSTVGDHLRVTINGVASEGGPGEGGPGDAHCTLANPSSFQAPAVIAFEAPAGAGSCPQLAAETTYFVVIEWVNPGGTGSFALIPQTYPTEESAATGEDPGGAEGWSIADQSHYLTAGSDGRTWSAYAETASFKIEVKEGAETAARANSPATGAPTISGRTQVGETLTADTSGIADADGMTKASFIYSWNAGERHIQGATGISYTLTRDQEGRTMQVLVGFLDDNGNSEVLGSEASDPVAAKAPNNPATGVPTISGTPQVGRTLTADTSAIADEDGLTGVSYRYQWLAGGTDISGATGSTYTLTASEQGKTITVQVTFTDDDDYTETRTSMATATVDATTPTQPLSLTVATGEQIQELDASWQAPSSNGGSAVTGYKVQWKESADSWDTEADVSEATVTGTTHTITNLTGGVEYAVRVMATNDVGDGPASTEGKATPAGGTSQQVVETENSAPTGRPAISGTPQVEQTLTASTSDIADSDGLTNVSYRYQWIAGGSDIDGATGSSYTLTYSEQGQTIQVRVTFTDDANNEESLTSQATVAVAAAPNRSATGKPSINGTPQVDQTLTADTSPVDDQDGLTNVSYRYQWTAGGTDIDGATGSSHTLTYNEQGQTIQVRVTFADDRNNAEALTSIATAEVAAAPVPLTVRLKVAAPTSHDGSSEFTFEIEFSEEFGLSYATLRDHAFNENGGDVRLAQRKVQGSNRTWTITAEPAGTGAVTIELPATTDCGAQGAICTGDGRKLSNSLSSTVSGPDQ